MGGCGSARCQRGGWRCNGLTSHLRHRLASTRLMRVFVSVFVIFSSSSFTTACSSSAVTAVSSSSPPAPPLQLHTFSEAPALNVSRNAQTPTLCRGRALDWRKGLAVGPPGQQIKHNCQNLFRITEQESLTSVYESAYRDSLPVTCSCRFECASAQPLDGYCSARADFSSPVQGRR